MGLGAVRGAWGGPPELQWAATAVPDDVRGALEGGMGLTDSIGCLVHNMNYFKLALQYMFIRVNNIQI